MKYMKTSVLFSVLCMIGTINSFCAEPKRKDKESNVLQKCSILKQKAERKRAIDILDSCLASIMLCGAALGTNYAMVSQCAQTKQRAECLANMNDITWFTTCCCLVGVYTGCVTCARIWQVYEPECCKAKKKPYNKAKNVQQVTMKRD